MRSQRLFHGDGLVPFFKSWLSFKVLELCIMHLATDLLFLRKIRLTPERIKVSIIVFEEILVILLSQEVTSTSLINRVMCDKTKTLDLSE